MIYLNGTSYFELTDFADVMHIVKYQSKTPSIRSMGTILSWGNLLGGHRTSVLTVELVIEQLTNILKEGFISESAMKYERLEGLCSKLTKLVRPSYKDVYQMGRPTHNLSYSESMEYEQFIKNCIVELVLIEFKFYI